jgi:hypothetical protein
VLLKVTAKGEAVVDSVCHGASAHGYVLPGDIFTRMGSEEIATPSVPYIASKLVGLEGSIVGEADRPTHCRASTLPYPACRGGAEECTAMTAPPHQIRNLESRNAATPPPKTRSDRSGYGWKSLDRGGYRVEMVECGRRAVLRLRRQGLKSQGFEPHSTTACR